MMRFLPAALIAVSVALVAAGGVAFALGANDGDSSDELLDRVAAELGLEPQAVKDAVEQAEREQVKEHQDRLLAELVERGVITQEEADSASAWLDSRPAAADKLFMDGAFFPVAIGKFIPEMLPPHGVELGTLGDGAILERVAEILGIEPEALREALGDASESLRAERRLEIINSVIDTAVKEGVLTEAEGEEVRAWMAEMPEWLMESDIIGRLMGAVGPAIFKGEFPPLVIPGDHPRFEVRPDLQRHPRLEPIRPDGLRQPGGEPFRFYFNGPEGEFNFDFEELPGIFPEMFKEWNVPAPAPAETPEPASPASLRNA